MFPGGSASKLVEERLADMKDRRAHIDDEAKGGVIDQIVEEILKEYAKNPEGS